MKTLNEKTFDLLEATGLNWTVTKEQLSVNRPDGTKIEVPTFGIMKGDKHLGSVGNRYTPFQNYQLAETIISATDEMNIETNRGGSLCDFSKVYLQAQLTNEQIGNSGVKRWITATNSHDGSSSIGFGSTNQVIVCTNTFHTAYKELNKFRHTISAADRIKVAIEQIKQSLLLDEQLMTNFKRMADLTIKDEMIEKVVKLLFKKEANEEQKDVSTRKINQINAFADSLSTSINEQGSTIWALFNAVTRYTNHVAAPKEENKKLSYIMDGGGYATNNLAFDEIMLWVDKNTAKPQKLVSIS
jgi:phage/plasmid-like protein (TIGR03299 family)